MSIRKPKPGSASVDDADFLRATVQPRVDSPRGLVTAVDLFAGCGGLTLGLWEAARRAQLGLQVLLAVDSDPVMAGTFKRNFPAAAVIAAPVEALFSGVPGEALAFIEDHIATTVGNVDVLCGGPPCQGHSDLNNHTRRDDVRNDLYLYMARAAEVLRPKTVLIENVPAVQRDFVDVVADTWRVLEKYGYSVEARVVDLSRLGVPQHRRRHLLIGTTIEGLDPTEVFQALQSPDRRRSVRWAIGDLACSDLCSDPFDTASVASKANRERIAYLFDNDLYDLPDSQRPACHRDKEHTYQSVYGRMRWDELSPTITTGFGSMGQGRYVHPSEQRTITPHEAARLQTFPDWYRWGDETRRGRLATMIGNAVPPLVGLRLGETLLQHLDAPRSLGSAR